jgi:ABC-type branched-subunit amino acid transport system ATPase component
LSDNLLEVRDLSKRFGGVVANNGISLSVPRGAVVGLIGPNGSGKTTLFDSIVGRHATDAGSVRFDGRDITRLDVPRIARLGLMRTFQNAHVYGGMTCLQNMRISVTHAHDRPGDLFAVPPRAADDKARELLNFVGLSGQRETLAGVLSFGQRKLLELAMALMSDPKMLLLDEPTAGVHPGRIQRVIARLRHANTVFGITLLVIEHNMRVIMELAARIYCLAHGQLLAAGTPAEIRADRRVLDAYLGAR